VETLTQPEVEEALAHWPIRCHKPQRPPESWGDPRAWTAWLVLGGRGAGKTRTGAEWVRATVRGEPGFAEPRSGRLALVGETFAAARDVMVEGPAGILAVHDSRGEPRPTWSPTLRRLEWQNGAIAQVFSSEDPDSLRGPQFEAAWCDELAKWRHPTETWDMLQFGLRLGPAPREVVTTTPRPIPLLKKLLADPRVRISRSRTIDNVANLAPAFLDTVVSRYAGTRLGRQELEGEMIEDREGALWSRDRIEGCRVEAAPPLARIVVAVDPPASSGPRADACGIVVAGSIAAGSDTSWPMRASTRRARRTGPRRRSPRGAGGARTRWSRRRTRAARWSGPCWPRSIPGVPVTTVHATRGKYLGRSRWRCSTSRGACATSGPFPNSRTRWRFRPGRALVGPLARPPRRARLGTLAPDARASEPRVRVL
jgi:phage terminase large subunit-like protein